MRVIVCVLDSTINPRIICHVLGINCSHKRSKYDRVIQMDGGIENRRPILNEIS